MVSNLEKMAEKLKKFQMNSKGNSQEYNRKT